MHHYAICFKQSGFNCEDIGFWCSRRRVHGFYSQDTGVCQQLLSCKPLRSKRRDKNDQAPSNSLEMPLFMATIGFANVTANLCIYPFDPRHVYFRSHKLNRCGSFSMVTWCDLFYFLRRVKRCFVFWISGAFIISYPIDLLLVPNNVFGSPWRIRLPIPGQL